MINSKLLISAAIAGFMTAGFIVTASAADEAAAGSTKCYGIAKAGKNDCASATGSHSCKGQAKVDGDAGDFVLSTDADCAKANGKTVAPTAK